MSQISHRNWPADVAAQAADDSRASFIRKTYLHLAGAIAAFMVLEVLLFQLVDVAALTQTLFAGRFSWLIVLVVFLGVSWLARWWAESSASPALQYAGLGLYVVAEVIIFAPLLFIATRFYPGAIATAAVATGAIFFTLTAFVMATGKDLSFLGGILAIASVAALVTIGLGLVFGFELGLVFTVLMILLAGGYILYDTSNVLHHYRVDQHVAASLALFASVALLFWYVLRLVMALQKR